MFKNYFKTAFRNLWKNKAYSFINIIGLTVGTLCCLYIVMYVTDQYSYDKHHHDAKDIYRIITVTNLGGDKHNMATCSPPIAPALKKDFAEVLQFTRMVPTLDASDHLLRYKEKSFYEKDAFLVDSTFFDVFNYHFVRGDATNALTAAESIVLLKPIADKLFGGEDPIDKVIAIEDAYGKNDFKVTGVVDESLGKSHVHATMFIKMNPNGFGGNILNNATWSGNNFTNSYIKLRPDVNVAVLEKKLPAFLNKYGAQQLRNLGMEKQLHLQPVGSIHTTSGLEAEPATTVSESFLYILILIAALIQVIACINFMNLSTARASKRAKEVGVRKVIGAGKKSLVIQFLGESFLLTLLSVLIALPLLVLLLPYLNGVTGTDIHLSSMADYRIWLLVAGIVGITGLVAGSYPAFYLSAFQVVKVIKGNFASHISAVNIRRSLVVFQFVLSIVLISSIIIIYNQLNYIKNKDLGFDKSQKLIFSFNTQNAKSKMPVFADDLKQLPEIKVASIANNYPGHGAAYNDWIVYLSGGNLAAGIDQQNLSSDENFIKATGMRLISGRDFRLHDSAKVLINETLMKRLGLKPENSSGIKVYSGDERIYEIAGVMKDFNYNSLREDVKPFMIICDPKRDDLHNMIISVSSNDYKALIGKIEKVWHKDLPAEPFTFSFLDEEVQKQYASEITFSNITNLFTMIAIIISCLGLFGLAAFSSEQRTKEIGIRKILGAGVFNLAMLLSKEFLKLVVVAIVIATPIAWWAMSKWVESFSYRINISWWMFAIAGIIAVFIALATVSFQAIKTAITNPVKSLRTE